MLSIRNMVHVIEWPTTNSEIWYGFVRGTHVMARMSDCTRQGHPLRPTGETGGLVNITGCGRSRADD
jgi:hypothetical protein